MSVHALKSVTLWILARLAATSEDLELERASLQAYARRNPLELAEDEVDGMIESRRDEILEVRAEQFLATARAALVR
jgi:hypothetical protein